MMHLTELLSIEVLEYLTLEGSFSAVSTATIARRDAFCRIFQDLQALHSFAPLDELGKSLEKQTRRKSKRKERDNQTPAKLQKLHVADLTDLENFHHEFC